MATANSAGRYRQMLQAAKYRPYWQYLAVMDKRTRKVHKAMDGKVFLWDDPFWQLFDPPNGWRCRCGKQSLSKTDVESQGLDINRSEDGELPDLVDWEKMAPPEWRYSPGREAFAPDFKSYEYLNAHTLPDGRRAIDVVRETYRQGLTDIRMTDTEYETWSAKDDDQGFQAMVATLPATALEDGDSVMIADTVATAAQAHADPRELWECLYNPDRVWEEDGNFWAEKDGLKVRLRRRLPTTCLQVEEVFAA